MKIRSLLSAVLGVALTAVVSRANVQTGDKPKLHFSDFLTHKTVDLADLKGKIVIVDFWATWCGPCMGEAGHMVALNEKYAPKGLQFIGISLDEDPSALKRVIADKGFTWPMSYEGQGWHGSTPKEWGINSIPQTFIIGPDGDVLWRGHPAEIDPAIESAFKDHPPRLVDPKTLDQASAALDQVDSALAANQSAKAIKLLTTVPSLALADGAIANRQKKDTDQLQAFGTSELAGVDPLVESGKYALAVSKLRDLSQVFAGTPVAANAKLKLNELSSNPKVQEAIAAEKTEKAAADLLATANQFKAQNKDEQAYPEFKKIVKGYPKTAAATEAADVVKSYEADSAFMVKYNGKANKKKAESLLLLADNYRQMGEGAKARNKYQEVLDQFPSTAWADEAKKGISQIGDPQ